MQATTGTEKRSGRVGYDERGNSVWEWQLETGVYSRDVSTQKLKKLELGDLSIADTAINQRPEGLSLDSDQDDKAMPGGGFNPYDSAPRSSGGGFNPYDNARAVANKMKPKAAAAEPERRKPADLQKLNEWMKLKKKLQGDRDEEK